MIIIGMTIEDSDSGYIPDQDSITECKTHRVKSWGYAKSENTTKKKARSEAYKEAKRLRDAEVPNAETLACPDNGCDSNSWCRDVDVRWTGFETNKNSGKRDKETKLWTWETRLSKLGWLECKCVRFTSIRYEPKLKDEFFAVRRALKKLDRASKKLSTRRKKRRTRRRR